MCPDFAAEHADVSTGGIGVDNDWTLTMVRSVLGREVVSRMINDGSIISRPADEDPEAIKLLRRLSIVSRRRWPDWATKDPVVGVPPPKKKAPAATAAAEAEAPAAPAAAEGEAPPVPAAEPPAPDASA